MTTTHETVPVTIDAIDEHPHIVRKAKERQELEAKLQAALDQRTRLIQERAQLQSERRQATVSNLLGDAPPPGITPAQDRLAAIDGEIEASDAFLVAVRDCL